jgi:TRAP-type C4-dicarboxylate transport system permease small subunit
LSKPHLWEKAEHGLARLEQGLTVILFTALILTICFNIVARNVFRVSSHRLMELAPVLVLWVALLGAALAVRYNRHIKIELLLRFLPKSWSKVSLLLTSLFGMLVSAALGYTAFVFVLQEIELFGAWGGLSVCFPLFFLSVFFRLAIRLFCTLTDCRMEHP